MIDIWQTLKICVSISHNSNEQIAEHGERITTRTLGNVTVEDHRVAMEESNIWTDPVESSRFSLAPVVFRTLRARFFLFHFFRRGKLPDT